jgi:hypothetical protein
MIWNPWKEIKRLREKLSSYKNIIDEDTNIISGLRGRLEKDTSIISDLYEHGQYIRCILEQIAAEEKPTSNATVKRMAKIAREALGV